MAEIEKTEQIEDIDELKQSDLIYSIAYMRANEAGLLGDKKLSPFEIGILGATSSDINETLIKMENEEITPEEARNEINNAIKASIVVFISNLYDKVTEPIVNIIKEKIPFLEQVAETVRTYVKTKIIEKGGELVEKAYNWVKNKIKILFS